ncbi:hypothetical protein PG993_015034 [Apiospora rasikravindrae]|uniref:Uncharacterized protein n=1 Tax=Apiospora rasikravindrae TaxID=990691 RepID=A0ABR1RPF8_9PEZI
MALSIFNKFHKKEGPVDTEGAAKAYAELVLSDPEPADALANYHWDITKFSEENPQSIDYVLGIYGRMCRLLPADMKTAYGTGEIGAHRSLSRMLCDQIRNFNGLQPEDVGGGLVERDWEFQGPEYANLTFRRGEVLGPHSRLGEALASVVRVRAERTSLVTAYAVKGRAHALGVAPAGGGDQAHVPQHLETFLRPEHLGNNCMYPWSKADFAAACVGFRAGAKTFLDECAPERREEVLRTWKDLLVEFLLEGDQATDDANKPFRDGDFYVKYHATVGFLPALPLFLFAPPSTTLVKANRRLTCKLCSLYLKT